MPQLTIFLDDGGVISDNNLRASQWQRLVGEFFVPLLGGTSEAWKEANGIVSERLFQADAWDARLRAASDYQSFDRSYQFDWLSGMCEIVGLEIPPEEACVELAYRATVSITCRISAAFPGVVDTIRQLSRQGYTLHTASGEPSVALSGYLSALKVVDCFGHLYGPDLVDTFKIGTEYYKSFFADLGINPSEALVVDDSPHAVNWASQVGAQAVLVSNTLPAEKKKIQYIKSLAELPSLLQRSFS